MPEPPSPSSPGADSTASDRAGSVSAWSPLRQAVFRALWIALIVSNIGTWMQSVGTAWLMTSLTLSSLLVALMQTAASLPIFLFGLPAGALADLIDRRKLLVVTETWMLLVALVLGFVTLSGRMSPEILLALTFLMGVGAALDGPLWQAIVPDVVSRADLPAAVAINATGYNVARAVGPALGGLVVAALGPAAVFILNAASFLWVVVVVYRWRRTRVPSTTPPEEMLGATAAGLRYVRHSAALRAVLVRVAVFTVGASALWALLPVVARRDLGLDATGYGVLLGSLGLGAVGSALILPRLRTAFTVDSLTAAATIVFAGAALALAGLRSLPLVLLCLMAGGMGWLTMMSSLTTAATTGSPGWVRARALAMYLLVFQGLMAAGGFAWGTLAERFGNASALSLAALTLVLGLVAIRRWPLHAIQNLDLSPSGHWPEPQIVLTPDPADGPVLITVEYRVPAAQAGDFLRAMDAMRDFRHKDGAISWGVYRDLADPDRYLETFLVGSWAEHVRQHARVTVSDQALEAHTFSFLAPGVEPVAHHLIAARTTARRLPAEPSYRGLT